MISDWVVWGVRLKHIRLGHATAAASSGDLSVDRETDGLKKDSVSVRPEEGGPANRKTRKGRGRLRSGGKRRVERESTEGEGA